MFEAHELICREPFAVCRTNSDHTPVLPTPKSRRSQSSRRRRPTSRSTTLTADAGDHATDCPARGRADRAAPAAGRARQEMRSFARSQDLTPVLVVHGTRVACRTSALRVLLRRRLRSDCLARDRAAMLSGPPMNANARAALRRTHQLLRFSRRAASAGTASFERISASASAADQATRSTSESAEMK